LFECLANKTNKIKCLEILARNKATAFSNENIFIQTCNNLSENLEKLILDYEWC
jgi:hypothetical protein